MPIHSCSSLPIGLPQSESELPKPPSLGHLQSYLSIRGGGVETDSLLGQTGLRSSMFVPAPLVLPLLGNGILSDFKEEEVKVPPDDDLTDF